MINSSAQLLSPYRVTCVALMLTEEAAEAVMLTASDKTGRVAADIPKIIVRPSAAAVVFLNSEDTIVFMGNTPF